MNRMKSQRRNLIYCCHPFAMSSAFHILLPMIRAQMQSTVAARDSSSICDTYEIHVDMSGLGIFSIAAAE